MKKVSAICGCYTASTSPVLSVVNDMAGGHVGAGQALALGNRVFWGNSGKQEVSLVLNSGNAFSRAFLFSHSNNT